MHVECRTRGRSRVSPFGTMVGDPSRAQRAQLQLRGALPAPHRANRELSQRSRARHSATASPHCMSAAKPVVNSLPAWGRLLRAVWTSADDAVTRVVTPSRSCPGALSSTRHRAEPAERCSAAERPGTRPNSVRRWRWPEPRPVVSATRKASALDRVKVENALVRSLERKPSATSARHARRVRARQHSLDFHQRHGWSSMFVLSSEWG